MSNLCTVLRSLSCALPLLLVGAAQANAEQWYRITAPGTGVSVDMPVDIFAVEAGPTTNPPGYTYRTPDKRADMSLYALPVAGRTPAEFARTNFKLPVSSIAYRRIT